MYHLKSLVEVWQQDQQQEDECLCEHFLLNPDVSGFGVCFGVKQVLVARSSMCNICYAGNFLIILNLTEF